MDDINTAIQDFSHHTEIITLKSTPFISADDLFLTISKTTTKAMLRHSSSSESACQATNALGVHETLAEPKI